MKQKDFDERLQASQSAKQAMMAKFRQRPGPDDPAVSERRVARAALSAARDVRVAERETKRLAEEADLAIVRPMQRIKRLKNSAQQPKRKRAMPDSRRSARRPAMLVTQPARHESSCARSSLPSREEIY
jgi:hypothetical protein